ncbi:MAG: hypothetical protein ABIR36_06075, partial [Nitrospiraceae bacterium]
VESPDGLPATSAAVCDFTVTVGPLTSDCLAATKTVSSSVAGVNVTVPLMFRVVEVGNVKGTTLVLIVVMLVLLATGTAEMTAVAPYQSGVARRRCIMRVFKI